MATSFPVATSTAVYTVPDALQGAMTSQITTMNVTIINVTIINVTIINANTFSFKYKQQ